MWVSFIKKHNFELKAEKIVCLSKTMYALYSERGSNSDGLD